MKLKNKVEALNKHFDCLLERVRNLEKKSLTGPAGTYQPMIVCPNCKQHTWVNIPLGLDIESYGKINKVKCSVCGVYIYE